MKLSDFQTLTANLSDAEFLSHPEVRRFWWGIVEPDHKHTHQWVLRTHDAMMSGVPDECHKCRTKYRDRIRNGRCDRPDEIPGSLADCVEQMRVKVAEKWHLNVFVCATLRDRFEAFADALGALEAEPCS